jgi:hypothetical protein
MTVTDPSRAGGEPAGSSSLRTLVSTLVAPREAFAALAARPAFALALVVLSLCAVGALWVTLDKVTAEDFVATLEASGRELPPEALRDPERLMAVSRWSQTIFGGLAAPVVYLVLAGLFLGAFRFGAGSDLRYRQSLAVTVHGMLPFAIAAVLGAAAALMRESVTLEEMKWGGVLASNLGILAGEGTGEIARALLTSVDLFSAWCVFLLATGYEIVARVSRKAAWTGVLTVWGLGLLLKVGIAAMT